MKENLQKELTKRYQEAADSFVAKMKKDSNTIAVIICGSLSYDQVWEKSDIDMTLVVRDQALKNDSFCIIEDDITINCYVVARSGFKRFLEGLSGGSFLHSFYAKGTMVYSTDDSLYEYYEEYKSMGMDDMALTVLFLACELIYYHEKSLKWIKVKKDPLYAQYFILKAAEMISRIELCVSNEIPTREAIVRATSVNPTLMSMYYDNAMSHHYSQEEIYEAIDKMDEYLEKHIDVFKKPILDYMADGEVRTVTMITKFFKSDNHFIIGILDYLADKGIIAKVSQPIRITPKSKLAVEEIAYQYINF